MEYGVVTVQDETDETTDDGQGYSTKDEEQGSGDTGDEDKVTTQTGDGDEVQRDAAEIRLTGTNGRTAGRNDRTRNGTTEKTCKRSNAPGPWPHMSHTFLVTPS